MSWRAPQAAGEPLADQTAGAPRWLWAAFAGLGLVLAAYVASLILRSPSDSSTLVDGWLVAAFELVLAALSIGRALTRRPQRAVALALGAAMLTWALGDVALTWQSGPPSPSLADAFYVAFYPLAYLGLVLLFRREASRLVPATWLDGAVAGLGAAALCAAFAFDRVAHLAGGGAAGVATNLAYPIGDVLLLAIIAGGSAIQSGRVRGAWVLVSAGCLLNAVGDTFNLVPSLDASRTGTIVDGVAWPAAIYLIAMAVWLRPRQTDVLRHERAPGFLLPGLGAASGLAILAYGSVRRVDAVAVGLATATLLAVGLRLGLSISGLRALTEERHRQAVTDELTGLGNRRRLAQVLTTFLADHVDPATPARRLAYLFVDLNHFKEINDSFGHPAGDELLKQLGPRIQGCLEGPDLLTRIGGDELAVVLIDADAGRAKQIASRLSDALHEPFELDIVRVRVGASIGIALAPGDADDADGLMRCADQAMYRSKQVGSAYELYDRLLDDESSRLRLVDDLRVAIDEHQLELHYQPQLDLRNGSIPAVEALLRWPHPRLGFIPPLEFLPLAEHAGLMRPLTTFVLDGALAQCARWRAEGHHLAVSVNISATNVLDIGFADLVAAQLRCHRVPPVALTLEITETTLISDFAECQQIIRKLRDLGCVVAIDDFGAGFTSLPHLGGLAVGELKLDRTFLIGLAGESRQRDLALIRATIELAHALDMQVVAEGIEDRATLDLLRRLGCDLAQGYAICRPMPAAELVFDAFAAA